MEILRLSCRRLISPLKKILVGAGCLLSTTTLMAGEPTGHPSYDRSSFASPFAGQPFTMGEIQRIHGQLPPLTTTATYNASSCMALPRVTQPIIGPGGFSTRPGWITYNLGTLGIVSPGWAGYPYWNPYGYYGGYPYTSSYYNWSYSTAYGPYGYSGFYSGYGLPYGWGPFWTPIANPMVPNFGLFASLSDMVNRGNARFGPMRPVRDFRPGNRNRGGGIVVPDAPPAGQPAGLNAIPPLPMLGNQGPMDPLKPDMNNRPDIDPQMALATLEPANGQALLRNGRRVPLAPIPNQRNAKPSDDSAQSILTRLQTGDRLAKNGLMDDARTRYKALTESLADQPAPWFRLAQLEVLAGNPEAALSAWKAAEIRSGNAEPGYSKKLVWSSIADASQQADAAQKLAEWQSSDQFKELSGLKATLNTSDNTIVTARKIE